MNFKQKAARLEGCKSHCSDTICQNKMERTAQALKDSAREAYLDAAVIAVNVCACPCADPCLGCRKIRELIGAKASALEPKGAP